MCCKKLLKRLMQGCAISYGTENDFHNQQQHYITWVSKGTWAVLLLQQHSSSASSSMQNSHSTARSTSLTSSKLSHLAANLLFLLLHLF
jgi:hypothetical protein